MKLIKSFVLVFLFAILGVSAPPLLPQESHDYNAIRCKEVIDGDTILLEDGKTLRYIGIDTPEVRKYKKGRWVSDPHPYADEAKELNRSLVEGKVVRVEFDVQRNDKYNRLLGYCYVGDTFVNAKLLEEGLAYLFTHPPNVRYVDLFVTLQQKARQDKKGIWAKDAAVDAKNARPFIGTIRTVQGKVLKARKSKGMVYLNFGKNWRSDFTVVIFKDSVDFFSKKGINPANAYTGKVVRVTGLIKEYNGPEIIVRHPSAIEIVE